MILKVLILCGLLVLQGSHALPPQSVPQDQNEELAEMKKLMLHISERMDRWDSFYMGRLEPRMIGAATSLANLDANIKHLQERAHVWDTFQHHVSAWNDQIKTLDRKLDLINKEQQKVESKLIPSSFENKLSELENKLDSLNDISEKDAQHPVFSEVAGRELLHNIKNLEKKLDRLQAAFDKKARSSDPETSNLLKDISDKIDGIPIQNDNEIDGGDNEVRHLGRACRRLVGPYKKLLNGMEALQGSIKEMTEVEAVPANLERSGKLKNSVLVDIRKSLKNIEDEIEELQEKNARNINENERILRRIAKKLDSEIEDDEDDEKELKKSLKRLIVDQREKLEDFIKKNISKLKKEIDDLEDDIEDLDDDDKDKDKDKDDDDSDDDEDDDSNDRKKKNKSDDDDDDDDDSDDDSDDDDDDSKNRKHSRRRNKNRSDDDDDDDDSDDSDDKPRRRKSKKDCDDTDEDDDDDTRERKNKGRKHRKNKKDDSDSDDDDDEDDDDDDDKKSKKDDKDDSDDDDEDDNSKNNDLTLHPNAEKSIKLKDVEEMAKHDAAENLAADGPSNSLSSFFGIPSFVKSSSNANSITENEIKGRK